MQGDAEGPLAYAFRWPVFQRVPTKAQWWVIALFGPSVWWVVSSAAGHPSEPFGEGWRGVAYAVLVVLPPLTLPTAMFLGIWKIGRETDALPATLLTAGLMAAVPVAAAFVDPGIFLESAMFAFVWSGAFALANAMFLFPARGQLAANFYTVVGGVAIGGVLLFGMTSGTLANGPDVDDRTFMFTLWGGMFGVALLGAAALANGISYGNRERETAPVDFGRVQGRIDDLYARGLLTGEEREAGRGRLSGLRERWDGYVAAYTQGRRLRIYRGLLATIGVLALLMVAWGFTWVPAGSMTCGAAGECSPDTVEYLTENMRLAVGWLGSYLLVVGLGSLGGALLATRILAGIGEPEKGTAEAVAREATALDEEILARAHAVSTRMPRA